MHNESERETDPYDTGPSQRDRTHLKDRKKARLSERYYDSGETSQDHRHPASAGASRSALNKPRRKDKDVEESTITEPRKRRDIGERGGVTVSTAPPAKTT